MNERKVAVTPGLSERWRVLGLFALASLPLLLLAAVSLWRNMLDAEERVVEERVTLARVTALTAREVLDDAFSTLDTLVLTRDLTDPAARPDLPQLLDRTRAVNPNLQLVGLYDGDGWNIAVPGLPPRTVNIGDREYFRRALGERRAVSPALIGRASGTVTLALAVPVELVGGGRGVLIAELSSAKLREELRGVLGDGSLRVVVVDVLGQAFVHPDPEVARALTPLRGRADVDAVLAGETGGRVSQVDGADSLVAYAPVPATGWGVLVEQPTAAAFDLARRHLLQAFGVYTVAAALAGGLAWYLGGRLSLLYRRQLAATTRAETTALELRETSEESEGRRRFLERLVAAAPVAISVLEGPEHRYISLNARALEIAPRPDALGKTVAEAFPEMARRGLTELLDRVYRSGEQVTGTDRPFEIDDGANGLKRRYLTFVLARYEDADGRPEGVLSIALDTTEAVLARRRAEQEKDEFLSTASHELKTPLSSLGLSAQMIDRMLGKGALDPIRLERYVGNIRAQVARATLLIGDLLDVSRIHADQLQVRREPVDLVKLGREAAQRARDGLPEGAAHEISIVDEGPLVIEGDEARLDQVLTNVLSNAVKYSPKGGRIEVRLARRDGLATLEVADQGIGVSESERDKLFAPFSRTAAARRSGVEGTGLGLYISRQIVEAHHGNIHVAETPGGGTTFSITLPLAERPAVESELREAV